MRESQQDRADSFAGAYAEHFERVYRVARASCGDHEVALEATQDAFALALARWPRLRSETWMPAWIMVTATNRCRRLLRREAVRRRLLRETPSASSDDDAIDRSAVRHAVRRLTDRQRQAILLHYFGGYSVAEISAATGMASGTVKTHLHRGRLRLQELLGDEGIPPRRKESR